jgi:hypothetical protein
VQFDFPPKKDNFVPFQECEEDLDEFGNLVIGSGKKYLENIVFVENVEFNG